MDLSVSYVNGSTSDLLTQAAGLVRAETAARAARIGQASSQENAVRSFETDEDDSRAWAEGLGDRFAPDTANTLLGAQEEATATQTAQTYVFDPLDTNKDGKVSYYEWLAGQTQTAPTASAA
jgi:hypothetical protein